MGTLNTFLNQVSAVRYRSGAMPVEHTVVTQLRDMCCPGAELQEGEWTGDEDVIRVAVVSNPDEWSAIHPDLSEETDPWMMFQVTGSNGGILAASQPHLLYHLFSFLTEDWLDRNVGEFKDGEIYTRTFSKIRPTFDAFLNQYYRTTEGFDKEAHFRTLARMGFSHAEVNGLAYPVPYEPSVPGEILQRFYTYCPALDQFVTSELNRGLYKDDYLQANLNNLKDNAALAGKYGLTPGLLSFEPRSVPDEFFQRYPMLRGARVDHPMRSFKPRYNLSIGHPAVLEHYSTLLKNLMRQVPDLGYFAIWSNDSGAGFEYTHSLYVGRNGGGYVIREWKSDEEIEASAAGAMMNYLRVLRDAGREINPEFDVVLRVEPFWKEREHIWGELEDGIRVQASTLQSSGWGMPYEHPRYDDVPEIHTTALHNAFNDGEGEELKTLREKGSDAEILFAPGILWNHEPLIGLPFPYLVYEKLSDLDAQAVRTLSYLGGPTPENFANFNINQEVVRAFQLDSKMDLDQVLQQKARHWVGEKYADDLVEVWRLADETFRAFPVPVWIYSGWGNWYRLLIRPLVPDIEAIPEQEREYYENYLLATAHNRNRIDLRHDVGFDLTDVDRAYQSVQRMDENLFPEIDTAISKANELREEVGNAGAEACAADLYDRLVGWRCWFRNQRNVAAWIAGVHGYLEADSDAERDEHMQTLHDMVLDEIQNTEILLDHWIESETKWMVISDTGETTFTYYKNFGEFLRKKIELMQGREHDKPKIDPDFQWRLPEPGELK